jgi:nitrite reductase/ring-hydroxylating ferredoxin subunit
MQGKAHNDSATLLCEVSAIGEHGKEVQIDGATGPQWLMLFHRDGQLTAWRNVCPHQGRSLNWAPDEFLFGPEGLLICSHHGATFELPSGNCVDGPCKGARLTSVGIRVEEGWVYLDEGSDQ